ncbi:PAQR family membrane homeostasis protein TrhA [Fulvimonas soli]|jgi:hemolysin III|uniref:Channel protein (Hemolysin III family) n=1 Tax=Fulvimonas soli TaxID=155197 RepID=A0A316HWJ1_9GAMM|nr:hemolysin III family protein [Fulvimonas soli]PWK85826.1 channel protein (hemolysin III family) [Fulvimonas soli]TNY27267.1 hemolysin III [Fulvimonas soli]
MSARTGAAPPRYAFADELASTVIHGIGILLSIAGLATLVAFAALHGDARTVTASAVFGAALILLYTASTLYHAIPGELPRRVLRTLDHIAIFLLIAGTYTPFTLLVLPGAWGWGLFGTIWALALAGSALELGLLHRFKNRVLAASIYVAMGWVALVAFRPLSAHLETGGLVLLVAGGAAYTLGVPFYLCRRLPFHHAVWHGFVLAGSVLHYLAVLLYVIPG